MDVNLETYGLEFANWWRNIQPHWRRIGDGPLSRTEPYGAENWTTLAKGGTAGVYVVVMALSWWLRALDASDTTTTSDVWGNVGDVSWALQCMRRVSPSLKRGHGEGQQQGTTKYVFSIFHSQCMPLITLFTDVVVHKLCGHFRTLRQRSLLLYCLILRNRRLHCHSRGFEDFPIRSP